MHSILSGTRARLLWIAYFYKPAQYLLYNPLIAQCPSHFDTELNIWSLGNENRK
jgi:hypothetical protein